MTLVDDLLLAFGQHRRRLAAQIEWVSGVASSVTLVRLGICFASIDMTRRDGDVSILGKDLWSLDKGGGESRDDMEFDVAVKGPDTWVVGSKSNDSVCFVLKHDSVALDWRR